MSARTGRRPGTGTGGWLCTTGRPAAASSCSSRICRADIPIGEQSRHPSPRRVRLSGVVFQTCPHTVHCHHRGVLLPGLIWDGRTGAFNEGCHSAAISGWRSSMDLPGFGVDLAMGIRRFAHSGHRSPRWRSAGATFHSWPSTQSHHTFFRLAGRTSVGLSSFNDGCHSPAGFGCTSAKLFPGFGVARKTPLRAAAHLRHPTPVLRL
jgi:hypothetical protein